MKRALQSIASTIVSGLSNVIVQLIGSSVLPAAEFAAFSIIATTIIFGLGMARAVIGQVDMLRGDSSRHAASADAALLAGSVFLALGLLFLAVATIFSVEVVGLVGVGLALVPAFAIQDALRFRSFRCRRPAVAVTSDAAILLVAILGIFLMPAGLHTPLSLALVWTGATLLGLALGACLMGYFPRYSLGGLHWLRGNLDLIVPGTGEYLLQAAVPYALNFLIIGVGGPVALAGYRLAQLLFGALGNLSAGLNAAMLPRLVDCNSPRKAQRDLLFEIVLLTSVSGTLLLMLQFLPAGVGIGIFGEAWSAMTPFLLVGAVHGCVSALAIPNFSLLRLLGRARLSFLIRVVSVLATVGFAFLAARWGDPVMIAWSIAVPAVGAYVLRLVVTEVALFRRIRRDAPLQPLSSNGLIG